MTVVAQYLARRRQRPPFTEGGGPDAPMTENSYPPGRPAAATPFRPARRALLLAFLLPLAACVTNSMQATPPAGGTAVDKNTPRGDVRAEVFKIGRAHV